MTTIQTLSVPGCYGTPDGGDPYKHDGPMESMEPDSSSMRTHLCPRFGRASFKINKLINKYFLIYTMKNTLLLGDYINIGSI